VHGLGEAARSAAKCGFSEAPASWVRLRSTWGLRMGDGAWQRPAGDVAYPDTSSTFTAPTAGYVLVFGLTAARASVARQGGEQPPRLATARRPEPAARTVPRRGKQTRRRWLRQSRSSMCAHARTHARKARHGGGMQSRRSARRAVRLRPAFPVCLGVRSARRDRRAAARSRRGHEQGTRPRQRAPPSAQVSARAHRSSDGESAGEASVVCIVTPSSIHNIPPLLPSPCCTRYELRWRGRWP
jgi:hypothetical protein